MEDHNNQEKQMLIKDFEEQISILKSSPQVSPNLNIRYSIAQLPKNLVDISLLENMRLEYERKMQEQSFRHREELN